MYWFQRWFEKIVESVRSEASATNDALKKQIDTIRIDQESADHNQRASAEIIARSINTAFDTTSSNEQTQRDKEYRLQRVISFLTFLAAGGAIAAAIGTWYSISAIKESADAAKKSADVAACALKENQRQFDITSKINQKQFAGTLGQMKEQSRSMRASADLVVSANRPWIVPDPPPMHKETIQAAVVQWHNTGKTPAVSVFSTAEYFNSGSFPNGFPAHLHTCKEMEAGLKKQPIDKWQYQGFVAENGSYQMGLSNVPPWIGRIPIWIHGCVWYTDVLSNTERSTEFFYVATQMKNMFPPDEGVSLFYLGVRPFVYK